MRNVTLAVALITLFTFAGCSNSDHHVSELKKKADSAYQRVSNNTIKNTVTGLLWQDNNDTLSTKLNLKEAEEYCKNLNLDGYTGWRLPSIEELMLIVNKDNEGTKIHPTFTNTQSWYYWSDTVDKEEYDDLNSSDIEKIRKTVYIVNFKDGKKYQGYPERKNYVRCVYDIK